jgi:hypothetical protein
MNILKSELGDFYTLDGEQYKGLYYIEKGTNIAYTYSENTKKRKVLVPYYVYNTETFRMRSNVKGGYRSPIPFKPSPTDYDYKYGYITRYFLQKRTSPQNTIIEVSEDDYSALSPSPSPTDISDKVYNNISIDWVIVGNEGYVTDSNKKLLENAEKSFRGIKNYLSNLLEFYK